jgi:hypothetical protein
VTRSLRALAAFGAFQEVSPGMFANTPVSEFFSDRPGGLRNAALFWGGQHVLESAAELGYSVRTGKSSFEHVYGESFWDRMRRLPDEYEMFNRALADLRSDEHQRIAGAYDWSGVNTVVDVGGGAGSLVAAILETLPGKRGVLIDQPEVLPDADRLLSARGVRDRCDFVGGSFFEPIAITGEVWAMCQVLHDWPDAECRHPFAVPRGDARNGPTARHRDAHRARRTESRPRRTGHDDAALLRRGAPAHHGRVQRTVSRDGP